jgi:hypothetical protein
MLPQIVSFMTRGYCTSSQFSSNMRCCIAMELEIDVL